MQQKPRSQPETQQGRGLYGEAWITGPSFQQTRVSGTLHCFMLIPLMLEIQQSATAQKQYSA